MHGMIRLEWQEIYNLGEWPGLNRLLVVKPGIGRCCQDWCLNWVLWDRGVRRGEIRKRFLAKEIGLHVWRQGGEREVWLWLRLLSGSSWTQNLWVFNHSWSTGLSVLPKIPRGPFQRPSTPHWELCRDLLRGENISTHCPKNSVREDNLSGRVST